MSESRPNVSVLTMVRACGPCNGRAIQYQLVLQMPAISSALDDLVAFEDEVEKLLGDAGIVDGHDLVSGEMNIFVLTDDPVGAFGEIAERDPRARARSSGRSRRRSSSAR